MKNLFKSGKGLRWWPDADAINAPDGALLRADNLVPDPDAQLALRLGSEVLYEGMQTRVHSLYSCILEGRVYHFAGCDDRLYRNGIDFGEIFAGYGDIKMGDDAFQAFFARSSTKKKFDGENLYNWSIPAPEFPATLTAVTAITTEVASFNSAESPAFTINEGTSAFVSGHDGTASGALKLTPDTTSSRASASKKFASDQDYLDILGAPGGDTDLFDIYVWLEDPREVDKITIMFGLNTGTDPFKDDHYYFDFKIKDAGTVDIKDSGSTAASAYGIYAQAVQSVLTPEEITDIKNLDQITAILKRLGRFAGPRSRERADAQEASPAWTHLTVTRGQFNRVGGTAGRNWKTVRGFKVVFSGMAGTTKVAQFDSAVWTGGGNRALTGRYKLGYRFVRDFGDKYIELSPMSPITSEIVLTQQALQVTIPAQALANKDPQVNQIWVYLFGGFLDTYYRFAVVSAVIRQGMTIDELTNPAGSDFQTKSERTRLTAWGFSKITGGDAVAADLIFTIRMSELEALIENEMYEPGAAGVPNDVVAIAGPYVSRMFVITKDGRLFPSAQDSPSSFSLYHHLDLRRYGSPLWMIRTGGGIYVGMTKDVIRIAGTGDESSDRISVDFYPEELHVGNPPVDEAVVTDGNSIVYRSADGLMMLTGSNLVPIPPIGTSMLWKGHRRHGVDSLNVKYGRFRLAMDNHEIFMIAPEGPSYTAPDTDVETVAFDTLTGFTISDGIITRSAATGEVTVANATRSLKTTDGYIESTAEAETATVSYYLGLSTKYNTRFFNNYNFLWKIITGTSQHAEIWENGVQILNDFGGGSPGVISWQDGDIFRLEVSGIRLYYKKNGITIYTSLVLPTYPLYPIIDIDEKSYSFGPINLSGNWTLVLDGSSAIWRYSLLKQQWSRCVYPERLDCLFRDPFGKLIAGSDSSGTVWELESSTQDDGSDIPVTFRSPVSDGEMPLQRKDPLDFQIHADTGSNSGSVAFYKDGSGSPSLTLPFSCPNFEIYRMNILTLGVLTRAQVNITGNFNKFLLHAYNMTIRERVQQVMVLDTGTIQPMEQDRMVWLTEGEIDCISPVDLELDIYLDDVLYRTLTVEVTPNKRSSYRIPFPRGTKARCPRLVFRTTNDNNYGNPGFEPYRVRVRDRGTGTRTDHGFRPIWPIGMAP